MTTKGKVLVLVSSGHGLPLKDGKVYTGAGYYLNELTVPVRALMKEGYEITFANPKGNTPQMDVHSAVADFFGGDEAKLQDYLKFRDTLTGLKNPTRISDVIASGLDQYDAVFVPGGHGPMMDLLDDPDAGTVMRHFHETSKPTAVLCHGPISLLSALPNSKEVVAALAAGDAAGAQAKAQGWIYSGYKMTIFSTAEEQQREPLEIGGKVLFYPDFALSTAGGDVSVLAPWTSYVLQDRELISGQNPFSDRSASETSSTGTQSEEEVGFSGIRIGGKPGTGGTFSIFRQWKLVNVPSVPQFFHRLSPVFHQLWGHRGCVLPQQDDARCFRRAAQLLIQRGQREALPQGEVQVSGVISG